jgi:hypothetical protein
MNTIFRRDQNADHDAAIRRRQALNYSIDQLSRAANGLSAARSGGDGRHDSLIEDARRRIESMQSELKALT